MQGEILGTATAAGMSIQTKASWAVAMLVGLPTTLATVETGQWSAMAVGAAVSGIAGIYAIVGLLRDKVIAAKDKQISELAAAAEAERARRKTAEEQSDDWERVAHRLEGELSIYRGRPPGE